MAVETIIRDDIDRDRTDAEHRTFTGLDGKKYEIDLCEENHDDLLDCFDFIKDCMKAGRVIEDKAQTEQAVEVRKIDKAGKKVEGAKKNRSVDTPETVALADEILFTLTQRQPSLSSIIPWSAEQIIETCAQTGADWALTKKAQTVRRALVNLSQRTLDDGTRITAISGANEALGVPASAVIYSGLSEVDSNITFRIEIGGNDGVDVNAHAKGSPFWNALLEMNVPYISNYDHLYEEFFKAFLFTRELSDGKYQAFDRQVIPSSNKMLSKAIATMKDDLIEAGFVVKTKPYSRKKSSGYRDRIVAFIAPQYVKASEDVESDPKVILPDNFSAKTPGDGSVLVKPSQNCGEASLFSQESDDSDADNDWKPSRDRLKERRASLKEARDGSVESTTTRLRYGKSASSFPTGSKKKERTSQFIRRAAIWLKEEGKLDQDYTGRIPEELLREFKEHDRA